MSGSTSPDPDLVLLHGKVLTIDARFSVQEAVAVRGGRVVAVADNDAIRDLAGPGTEVIPLGGRTVVPGLIDSHIHALRAGLTWDAELHWEDVSSLREGLAMVAARAQRTPSGQWIHVAGGWHVGQLQEQRLPSPDELTALAPQHPVAVQHVYDRVVLNRAAVAAAGLTADTPDPFMGFIDKDPASGEPTGVVMGFGGIRSVLQRIPRPSIEQQTASTASFFRALNQVGVTTVDDAAGSGQVWPDSYAAVKALHDRDAQTVRVNWWMQPHQPGQEKALIARFVETVPLGSGDDWLRPLGIGELPLMGIMDGDGVASPPRSFSAEALADWRDVVRAVAASGWGLHVHTCRDHSARQLLEVLEEVDRDLPIRNRRFYFDHLEDGTPETMRRIQALGGGISFQDRAAFWDEGMFVDAEQATRIPPLRTALETGVPMGAGTDATGAANYSPFTTLWWMVTGSSVSGTPARRVEERLGREEALRLHTLGSAWFSFDEDRLGSIEPGKAADLVVLSGDYLTVPDDGIHDLDSVLTVVAGRPVYAAGDFQGLA